MRTQDLPALPFPQGTTVGFVWIFAYCLLEASRAKQDVLDTTVDVCIATQT